MENQLTEEQLKQKLQEQFTASVTQRVREVARNSLLEVIALNLGTHDLMLLSALGVDGREVFLQALIEEAKTLIAEGAQDDAQRTT